MKTKIKNTLYTLIAILGFANVSLAQVPSYVPTDSLKGWWGFNGNANDGSGNGNNGTLVNGPTLSSDRYNISNNAYSFDGIDDYIQTPVNSTNNYSISAWINPSMISQMYILGNDDELFSGKSFYLTNNGGLSIYNCHPSPSGCTDLPSNVTSSNTINSNTWTHIIASVNNGYVTYYVNGVVAGTSSGVEIYGVNWKIGAKGNLYSQLPFKGKLDDIGIWSKPLTQLEVLSLYYACNDTIINQPINISGAKGTNKSFSFTHSGTGNNYKWQSNSNSLGWQNVPNGNQYSGATSNNLSVNNLTVSNHNQLFRVITLKTGCADTSNIVKLTVSDVANDSIGLKNANDSILKLNVLYTNKHDTLYIGSSITSDTLRIAIRTGILSASPIINSLKVYPNPAATLLHIDLEKPGYYIAKLSSVAGQSIISPTTGTIDISALADGVYILTIYDSYNKLISTNKVAIVK